MRAAIYVRISSDREGAGLGVAAQESDCRTLATANGYTVTSVHTDNDVSAYSGKPRPGYLAMLAEVEDDSVDVVLAWHTDRLHRSVSELEHYAQVCADHNVTTLTVKAGPLDLSNPSGLLVARMLGSVARYEIDHMVERQRRAKRRSAESGVWKGGRRPFGYAADGVTIVPAEADAIRSATTAALAGDSMRGIAKSWNEQGLTTSVGKRWDMTAVHRVLVRPRNAGLMEHQGEVIGEAEWPAIVTPESWHAVVALLSRPERRTTTGNARKWFGSGLFKCGVCQETVISTKSGGVLSYRCRAGHVTRNMAEVDLLVREVIAARLRLPDARDLLARAGGSDIDTDALEARAVTLRALLDDMAEMFATEQIDAQQLAQGSRSLNGQLEAVRDTLADALHGTAVAGIAEADDPGQAWLDAPFDRRRAVLDALAVVTLKESGKGRPKGWEPGSSYFRPESVLIEWRGNA